MSNKPIFEWHGDARYAVRLAGDPRFAAERVRKSALAGDPGGQLGWAHMLLEGHGIERDLDAAFRWFQLAGRSGSADAINMVGRCHELGWGTALSLSMAAHCYRVAAGMGHAWAQFNLACLMLRDDGVQGELTDALALLARSARRGNVKAMNMLGRCCEEGWRGKRKPASARRWYARAARGGCFRGCFHTARYVMGDGDVETASVWLRRSIAAAPADFCEEIGRTFAQHPNIRLREISALAIERACRAPKHPASQSAATKNATPAPKPSLSRLKRSQRTIGRMARKLTGAGGLFRS